jgi:hypothetical protein
VVDQRLGEAVSCDRYEDAYRLFRRRRQRDPQIQAIFLSGEVDYDGLGNCRTIYYLGLSKSDFPNYLLGTPFHCSPVNRGGE